jgi:hypothetical protein
MNNSHLRNECGKTFFAHERKRSECFICANVPNKSSRIEVRTIFFETNNRVYYYQVKLFSGECFLDDFEALMPEIDIRALVLQNHSKSIRISARTSILRTCASKWPATA